MKRSKNKAYILVLTALVFLSVFELNGDQSALLMICIASVLWLYAKQPNVLLPPVVLVTAAYIFGYSIPILFPGLYQDIWNRVAPHSLEYGMLWSVRGFGAFAVGFALAEYHIKRAGKVGGSGKALFKDYNRYMVYLITSIGMLSLFAWLASVTLFGISLVFIKGNVVGIDTAGGTLLQVLTLLSDLRYPFFFGYFILYHRKQTNRKLFFFFVALLFISGIQLVVIGSKGSIIKLLIMGILAQAFLRIKFNFMQIVRVILIITIVYGSFTIITEYRSIMRYENRVGKDVFSFEIQLESFKTAILLSLPFSESSRKRQTQVNTRTALSRFGKGIYSFSNLMEFTSQQPPYEHLLESFLVPIYSIMPRFLMPEKPIFFDSGTNANRYYGRSYGGISVSLLGSFYYAWGYAGILFGMMFLGFFLAYVEQQARSSNKYSQDYLVLFVILLLSFMDVGVTFQSIAINIIRVGLLLLLLHFIYSQINGARQRRTYVIQTPQMLGRH